ncbi:MAG: winged helix-turn-helix domain-containing protein [Myxococcota bacterium]
MPFVELETCRIDLRSRSYEGPEGEGALTETEARLFAYLVQRPWVDVSRDELLIEVWRHPVHSLSRVVDTTMRRLRAKLERIPARPRHLLTRHGHGYRFEPLEPTGAPPEPATWILIGRDRERAWLATSQERCITLFGPGGIGKSALARSVVDDLPAPVTEVALQSVHDEASLVAAIARARGLRLDVSSIDRLVDAWDPEARGTLVLDTAEHLVVVVRKLVCGLLQKAMHLKLILTSRTVLGIDEECLTEVSPLDEESGAQLVRHHASLLGVEVGEAPARALARRLSGVPLAIELAVAHCRTLSPADLLERLDRDVGWLKSRHPPHDARHRTLVDALSWSWTLLDDGQRTAACQLAIFPGSFDLTSAEAVIDVPGRQRLDLLGDLIDTAWVERTDRRYRLLDPVRDYLRGKSEDPVARQRHLNAMIHRISSLLDESGAVRKAEARPQLQSHLQDFLVAFEHAALNDDARAMALLAFAIQRVLRHSGPADQLASILARAWARRTALEDDWRSYLGCLVAQHRADALVAYDEPLADARAAAFRTDHDGVIGRFLALEGSLWLRGVDFERARSSLVEAVSRSRRGGWLYFAAYAQANLSYVLWTLGEVESAIETAVKARRGFVDLDAVESVSGVDEVLAGMQCAAGRHQEGLPRLERALRAAKTVGRNHVVLATRLQMTLPLVELGQFDDATMHLDKALSLADAIGSREFQVDGRYARGVLCAVKGDLEAANEHLRDAQLRGEDHDACAAGIYAWRAWVCLARGHWGEGRALIEGLPNVIPRDDDRALVQLASTLDQPPGRLDEALASTAAVARRSIVVRLFRRRLLLG